MNLTSLQKMFLALEQPNALGERRGPPRPSRSNRYAVRLRGRRRDPVRIRRAIVRNASFTARVSGNIFATSEDKGVKSALSSFGGLLQSSAPSGLSSSPLPLLPSSSNRPN